VTEYKIIYAFRWTLTDTVQPDSPAFTDKARAERFLKKINKDVSWLIKLFGGKWVLTTLTLAEGPHVKQRMKITASDLSAQ